MIRRKQQAFDGGVVRIFRTKNNAAPGNLPKEDATGKVVLRFRERVVGLARFWDAKQANVTVDRLIRCPYRPEVSTQDLAEIGERIYQIRQVQYSEDVVPPVMDLSLERTEQRYDDL